MSTSSQGGPSPGLPVSQHLKCRVGSGGGPSGLDADCPLFDPAFVKSALFRIKHLGSDEFAVSSRVNLTSPNLEIIGWREWLSIPDLGIPRIKAKVDTGARTSCLHTCGLEIYESSKGQERVRFTVHPLQRKPEYAVECDRPVVNQRQVKDSGGHEEVRPFILVPITLGPLTWEVEFSLTNRDNMKFRMLLGRTAMKDRFLVHPGLSYQLGKSLRRIKASQV